VRRRDRVGKEVPTPEPYQNKAVNVVRVGGVVFRRVVRRRRLEGKKASSLIMEARLVVGWELRGRGRGEEGDVAGCIVVRTLMDGRVYGDGAYQLTLFDCGIFLLFIHSC